MGRALSDHQPYCIELDLSITAINRPSSTQFSYSRVDWEELANYFRTHKFSPYCYSSVDILTCSWYKWINDGIARHVPKRTKHRRNLPPWTSQATSNLIKIANTRRKHVDYSTPTTVAQLCTAEVSAMNALNNDKQQYECDVISSRNFGDLYRYFKSVKGSSTLPDKKHWNRLEAATDIDKADLFNKYFASVYNPLLHDSSPLSDEQSDSTIHHITITNETIEHICAKMKISVFQARTIFRTAFSNICTMSYHRRCCFSSKHVCARVFSLVSGRNL